MRNSVVRHFFKGRWVWTSDK